MSRCAEGMGPVTQIGPIEACIEQSLYLVCCCQILNERKDVDK